MKALYLSDCGGRGVLTFEKAFSLAQNCARFYPKCAVGLPLAVGVLAAAGVNRPPRPRIPGPGTTPTRFSVMGGDGDKTPRAAPGVSEPRRSLSHSLAPTIFSQSSGPGCQKRMSY